jgi:hypothetical protein
MPAGMALQKKESVMKSLIRRSIIAAASLLTISCSSISAGDIGCRTILTGREAIIVLNQCSRMRPEHDSLSWTPSKADIDTLEHLYPSAVGSLGAPRPGKSCFQYAGFTHEGKRYIYVNAYPRDFADAGSFVPFNTSDDSSDTSDVDWSRKAMVICDGGPAFFGMIYDVAGHSFSDLSFNGIG